METSGTEINGETCFYRVADAAAKTEAPVDLVVMAVKTYQRAEALAQIDFLVGKNTVILPLMNGVGLVRRAFGDMAYDESLSNFRFSYRVISFEEAIRRTECAAEEQRRPR